MLKVNFIHKLSLLLFASLTVSAHAQIETQPHRVHRYDSFAATPTRPGQTVFIGNSITHMHEWWEAFGGEHSIIERGNYGTICTEVLDNLESFIDSKPEKIFLSIGTNDLAFHESIDTTERRIRAIIERIQLESPSTKIYLQSILPRDGFNGNSVWEKTNNKLEAFYADDPEITFINLYNVVVPMNWNKSWSLDQLHPQPKAYAAWLHHIKDYVGYTCIYPLPDDITDEMQPAVGLGGIHDMRTAQFALYPAEATDVLIFGDEHIHAAEWHELMNNPHFKDRGSCWTMDYAYSLTRARSVIDIALRNRAVQPAKIVLNYGEGQKSISAYGVLLDSVKSLAPDAKVYIMNLPPRLNPDLDAPYVKFNNDLKNLAEERGATYIDIYTPLAADLQLNIMDSRVNKERGHLTGRGYTIVANAIAAAMPDEKTEPLTLDQYDALVTRRKNRTIIGNAVTNALLADYGDDEGQINESYRNQLKEEINIAVKALNSPTLTADEANEAANVLNEAVEAAKLGQPITVLTTPDVATTDNNDVYDLQGRRITSPSRGIYIVNGQKRIF